MNQTGKAAKKLQPCLVRWRRELHALAEVGLELPGTLAYLERELGELGITPYRLGPGLVADLKASTPGPTLLLRSDMDALPLREETGLPFACTEEAMHACGHDGHMAMLLGAAAILVEDFDAWNGGVRLLFQPGEELAKGAAPLIAAGVLEGVDAVCALHIGRFFDELATGQVGYFPGTAMASMDRFTITFRGKGTHGAAPHKGIDPIVMAGEYIAILQTLVSREIPASHSAVVSLGRIEGGRAFNVIPDEVHLEGTFRALTVDDRELLGRRVQEVGRGIAALHGGLPPVGAPRSSREGHHRADLPHHGGRGHGSLPSGAPRDLLLPRRRPRRASSPSKIRLRRGRPLAGRSPSGPGGPRFLRLVERALPYGTMSAVVPPVALTSYTAADLAQAQPLKVALTALGRALSGPPEPGVESYRFTLAARRGAREKNSRAGSRFAVR